MWSPYVSWYNTAQPAGQSAIAVQAKLVETVTRIGLLVLDKGEAAVTVTVGFVPMVHVPRAILPKFCVMLALLPTVQ